MMSKDLLPSQEIMAIFNQKTVPEDTEEERMMLRFQSILEGCSTVVENRNKGKC